MSPTPFTIEEQTFGPQQTAPPTISVLIPFYKDDPTLLLDKLAQQANPEIEIILYDDGTKWSSLTEQIVEQASNSTTPVQLLTASKNQGRSSARNVLVERSTGEYLLFLDADMAPETHDFLCQYLEAIRFSMAPIIFGGFSVEDQVEDHSLLVHSFLSSSSDCLPAEIRNQNPAKHVCTSNLLVRRDIFAQVPFDTGFVGWGWEDVEWAARAAEQYEILHIDNAAIHYGLESDATLLQRFRDSAANYARFVKQHPKLASTLPSYRTAKLAGKLPGFSLFRPLFAWLTRDRWHLVPIRFRVLALKLWRASWYAEALP